MKEQWQQYSNKFLQLTSREQLLLLLTGLIAVFFVTSYLFIDVKSEKIISYDKKSKAMASEISTLNFSINEFKSSLKQDPNIDVTKELERKKAALVKLDKQLVLLTTDLISPIEMRAALLKLLELEPGVSLLSFELSGAKPLLDLTKETEVEINHTSPTAEQLGVTLYKHGIKITLSGEYFQLRNYLRQLEQLSWKFFWQAFTFEVKEYPQSEVEITIYSLGLNEEFIGV